jgi:ceramide glucosyltransferase
MRCAGCMLLFRVVTALHLQQRLTKSNKHLALFWLVPISDLLGFVIWALSFLGNSVVWRGQKLRVQPDGTLQRPA